MESNVARQTARAKASRSVAHRLSILPAPVPRILRAAERFIAARSFAVLADVDDDDLPSVLDVAATLAPNGPRR